MRSTAMYVILLTSMIGLLTGLTLGLVFKDVKFRTGLRVLVKSLLRLSRKKWMRIIHPEVDLAHVQRDRDFVGLSADQRAGRVDEKARAAVAELKQGLLHKFNGRINSVYMFGSRVRGDYQLESDVDVGIFLTDTCPSPHMLRREIRYQSAEILIQYGLFIQPRIFAPNPPENRSEIILRKTVLSYGISV